MILSGFARKKSVDKMINNLTHKPNNNMNTVNTVKSGLKSWKTTTLAITMSVLLILQNVDDLSNYKTWIFPVLLTIFGILQRDADKTSENSGIK